MTELTHVSIEPLIERIRPVSQAEQDGYKPLGLWYEVDGDWRRWCREEEWGLERHVYLHRLEFGDENMLRLSSPLDLDVFTAAYSVDNRRWPARLNTIDWIKVAASYDGLEIAPYIWSKRLELSWYYGWDCASGVIWTPRGAKLTPIGVLDGSNSDMTPSS